MGLLSRVLARLRPPTLEDPDFGRLLYMHISRDPSLSYWEGEWMFPPTQSRMSIAVPGDRSGPTQAARSFYLALPLHFDSIVERARPELEKVFLTYLQRPLHADVWSDLKLAGFGVVNPGEEPLQWDVAFETTGAEWLGITVPFIGEIAQDAAVDT